MRRQVLALVLVGCGGSGSSARSASPQTVVVVPASTAPPEESTPAPSVFRCSPSRAIEHARITGAFSTESSVLNAGGEALAPHKVQDVEVVYTIRRLAPHTPERAEIVLERHDERVPSGRRRAQDGWVQALEDGWIRQGFPFVIERHGDSWCFVDKPCLGPGSRQQTFLGLIGTIASLLVPLPEVATQLDGKPNAGELSFDLPEVLAIRVGVNNGKKVKVTATGPGVPAAFEAVVQSETPGEWGPAPERTTNTARLQIDEYCRVRETSQVREKVIPLGPPTPGGSRIVDLRRWRTDPID